LAFTGLLASHGIAISIDGKGAWRDNVLVERLWKSIKYEEVYLHAYERFHRAVSRLLQRTQTAFELDDMTPDQAYFTPTAAPRGGLTPTEAPLIDAELLCRQPDLFTDQQNHYAKISTLRMYWLCDYGCARVRS